MSDKIALFDMDGTLFDYEGQLRKDLEAISSPHEPKLPENLHDAESFPWIKSRMRLIKSQQGWWKKLPPLALGWDVMSIAQQIGFAIQVLTKGPQTIHSAWSEKAECIYERLKKCPNIVAEDKQHYYGRVLCDDYENYVLGWLEHRPRGLAIVPGHHYNVNFQHPNVIRYTGENKKEVERALKAAFNRESGQHWKDLM